MGDHHFTTIARLKEWVVQCGCGWRVWPLQGSSDLLGEQDEGNSTVKIFGIINIVCLFITSQRHSDIITVRLL